MELRERLQEPEDQLRDHDPSTGPAGGGLDALRAEGQACHQVAEEAINKALSANSLEFLEATTQTTGQEL